jgi:hypothetical protein
MFVPKTQSDITGYTPKLKGLQEQDKTNLNTAAMYVRNSISKLQIQVATYVFELSAENCHR